MRRYGWRNKWFRLTPFCLLSPLIWTNYPLDLFDEMRARLINGRLLHICYYFIKHVYGGRPAITNYMWINATRGYMELPPTNQLFIGWHSRAFIARKHAQYTRARAAFERMRAVWYGLNDDGQINGQMNRLAGMISTVKRNGRFRTWLLINFQSRPIDTHLLRHSTYYGWQWAGARYKCPIKTKKTTTWHGIPLHSPLAARKLAFFLARLFIQGQDNSFFPPPP